MSMQQIARHIVNVHTSAGAASKEDASQEKDNWLKRYKKKASFSGYIQMEFSYLNFTFFI